MCADPTGPCDQAISFGAQQNNIIAQFRDYGSAESYAAQTIQVCPKDLRTLPGHPEPAVSWRSTVGERTERIGKGHDGATMQNGRARTELRPNGPFLTVIAYAARDTNMRKFTIEDSPGWKKLHGKK